MKTKVFMRRVFLLFTAVVTGQAFCGEVKYDTWCETERWMIALSDNTSYEELLENNVLPCEHIKSVKTIVNYAGVVPANGYENNSAGYDGNNSEILGRAPPVGSLDVNKLAEITNRFLIERFSSRFKSLPSINHSGRLENPEFFPDISERVIEVYITQALIFGGDKSSDFVVCTVFLRALPCKKCDFKNYSAGYDAPYDFHFSYKRGQDFYKEYEKFLSDRDVLRRLSDFF